MRPENMGNAFIAHSQDPSQSSSISVESQSFYINFSDTHKTRSFTQVHQFAIVLIASAGASTCTSAISVVANGSSVSIIGYHEKGGTISCNVNFSGTTISFTSINGSGNSMSASIVGIG